MDIATILGIVSGFGLIAGAILLGGTLQAFWSLPSLLIVAGGTLAATLINQKLKHVLGAFSVALNVFLDKSRNVAELVEKIHELSQKARKEGVLGLEQVEIDDPFLARGVALAIDGLDKDFIAQTMQRELATVKERHQRGQQIFRFMSSTAPAMGMIGTLIGLVNMLQALDDPSKIGPAMSTALLATFYGAVLAFLVFGPIAEKLESRTKEEILRGKIAIAGIESVANGDNKTVTQAKLDSLLSPRERGVIHESMKKDE